MRCWTLMVRSAPSRVSNHEASGKATMIRWLHPSRRIASRCSSGEVFFLDEVLDPHGEERVFARLEP
jgi:hypothetical protein